jgi:hypothetical protein
VWLAPQWPDKTQAETLAYIVQCATAAETLRGQGRELVFLVGCELTLFMQGILPGRDFMKRISNPLSLWWNLKIRGNHNRPLRAFLAKSNSAVRQVFKGLVTYAAAPIEQVDWALFDYVCLDYYREARVRDSYAERLKRHFAHGKPVIITEVGCCTYRGAEDKGARAWEIVEQGNAHEAQIKGNYIRDEANQAREILDLLTILEGAGVEGTFVFTFVSPNLPHNSDPKFDLVKSYANGHGLTYPDMPWEPKESFRAVAGYFGR